MSESITWEVCPGCGRTAAVGWRDSAVIEVDCVSGCRLSEAQLRGIEADHGGRVRDSRPFIDRAINGRD